MDKNCRLKVELSKNEPRETICKFILNENGENIGWCNIKLNKFGVTEMNYEIYNQYRGHGYAVEAIRSVLEMLKDSRRNIKIFAKVIEKNIGAWRVLEKTGFNLEKVFLDKEENAMARIYIYDSSAYI